MSELIRSYKSVCAQIMNGKHAFQILGVHKESTDQEVSLARRALARYVHPDVNGTPAASEMMSRVNAAHDDALTARRARYIVELNLKPCGACKGRGVTVRQKGFTATVVTICATCHGAGGV